MANRRKIYVMDYASSFNIFFVRVTNSLAFCIFLIFFMQACSPVRYVEPLKPKDFNVTIAGGGAIFDYQDNNIPLPLSSVVVGYGLQQDLSVWVGLHTTSAAYGVLHSELGFVKTLHKSANNFPSFSIAPSAHFMRDKWEKNSRAYPTLDFNFYWKNVLKNDTFYIGMNNWFELSRTKAHKQKQSNRWIPSFQSGYTYHQNKFNYTLELKYIAPTYSNDNIVVDYMSPTDSGAIGLYFSVGRTF